MSKVTKVAVAAACAFLAVATARAQSPTAQGLAQAQQRILGRQNAAQQLAAEVGIHMGGLVKAFLLRFEGKGVKFMNMRPVIADGRLGYIGDLYLADRNTNYPVLYRIHDRTANFMMTNNFGVASAFRPQGGAAVMWSTIVDPAHGRTPCTLNVIFETAINASPTFQCTRFVRGDDDAAMNLLLRQAVAHSLGVKAPAALQRQAAPVPLSPRVQHVLAGLRAQQ